MTVPAGVLRPTCRSCGTEIPKHPQWSFSYYSKRLYCNSECASSERPTLDGGYSVNQAGCWEWQGLIDRNGYGRTYDETRPKGRRSDWAHRVSYRSRNGEIPDGYEIDHMCENTRCMNPDHLQAVTRAEHVRITWERSGGRLRAEEAAHLRHLGLSYQDIADALGLVGKNSAHARVAAAIRAGVVDRDELPKTRSLEPEDTEDIRLMYALGVPQREIAQFYRVDSSHVSRVINGRPDRRKRA